jgi:hypothetical protein
MTTFLPCTAVSQPVRPTLKLKIMDGRPVVDGVFLNGQGPYRFLLDTGSQTNQLESGLARKLGLTGTFKVDLYTPSGPSIVQGGHVDKVTLGPVDAAGQEFLFTGCDGLHALSQDIRGILGQEFLAHFDYTLDLQHHQLMFRDPPALGSRIKVRLIYGRMAIPTSQGDLVLDSGANTLFLFRESSRPTTSTVQVRSASGLIAAASVQSAPELHIGDRVYRPASAEFHAVPAAEEAGLLPVNLFHAIFICNSEGYVVFDSQPQR